MKNIFLFLVIFASCKSFEKETAAVNELASSWESLTANANGFSEMLNFANADYTEKIASVAIDSVAFNALSEEEQSNIITAKNNFMEVGADLSTLTNEFGKLMEDYNAKSDQVMILKELPATQSFTENTLSEVNEITDFVSEADEDLGQFKESLESLKGKLASTHSDLMSLMTEITI